MTITTDIPRLNYSKPPPGYTIVGDADEPQVRSGLALSSRDSGWVWVQGSITDGAPRCIGTNSWAEALAATWADYKAHNDPPGLDVAETNDDDADGWGFTVGNAVWSADWDEAEARAAAWTWHDRRHTLAERDKALHPNVKAAFADYLAMSDADCDLAEKILTNDERRAAARGGCCVGNATALAALDRAITRLEEVGASALIPDVDALCDLKDRLVILAQECSSRTADIRAAARQHKWSPRYIDDCKGTRWDVHVGRDAEGLRCAWLTNNSTGERMARCAFERKIFATDDPDFSGFETLSDLFEAIKAWAAKPQPEAPT